MLAVGRIPLALVAAVFYPFPVATAVHSRQPARHLKCVVHESGVNLARLAKEEPQPLPPACSSWGEQLDRLTGTSALPLSPELWSGGLETQFPLSLDALRRASRPADHAAALLRLRLASLRLVQGQPLTVTVLGGSMPQGVDSAAPYSALMQEHFRALGFDVTVHNFAWPATTSEFPVEHVIPLTDKIRRSDVVIVDYSINDVWAEEDGLLRQGVQEGYRRLVQVLLELPSRPAVVEFATMGRRFYAMDRYGKNRTNHSTAVWGCTDKLADLIHAETIQNFSLPVVSFPDAVCHASMPFWFSRKFWAHPNATTHDLIARLFLGVFAQEAQAACTGLLGLEHPQSHVKLEDHTRCFTTSHRRNVDFDGCREDKATACEQFPVAHDASWVFGPDLPKKPPGWFVEANATQGSEIVFPVDVSRDGWIRIDYLATYENIGSIQCWLPGLAPDAGCRLNGLISARFSTRRSAYLAMPGLPEGPVDVHCRTLQGKFKLLGVASC